MGSAAPSRPLARLRLFKRTETVTGWLPRPRLPQRWRRRKPRLLGHARRSPLKGLWRFAAPILRHYFRRRATPPAQLWVKPSVVRRFEPMQLAAFEVRLAESGSEVEAAQRLRYRVFYEEMGAVPTPEANARHLDRDAFDGFCDHLLVLDKEVSNGGPWVVGTYRLLRRSVALGAGGFYSEKEYDLSTLKSLPGEIVELGRSCVDRNYRSRGVLQALWRGLAAYVRTYDIHLMFGCASFSGTNPRHIGKELSYLYHYHLAPRPLRPRALPQHYVHMGLVPRSGLDVQAAIGELPPLIKGYLRVGGFVGDGAVVDRQFNTTDVCIIVKTDHLTDKYERRYRTRA